jgi:ribosome modulation factor
MVRMIRDYLERTGFKVGYKPAGGISKSAKDALNYQFLMKEELGRDWLEPICSASAPRACWAISSASSNIMSPGAIRPDTGNDGLTLPPR